MQQRVKAMRFVTYLRVSTDEQALGLDAQLDLCRAFAARAGGELAGPFSDDGISGGASIDKRPALMAAIADLRRGDVLLVANRLRLARDPIISAMAEAACKRRGARIVSAAGEGTADDDPASILMRRLIDCFGEYERLLIGARTKSALQAKIRRGQRCGAVRFGYDLAADGVTLVPNAAEQAVLDLIRQERAKGLSLRAIAELLNKTGVATKSGKPCWKHTTIKGILGRVA